MRAIINVKLYILSMHFMIRKIAKDMSVRKRNPERKKGTRSMNTYTKLLDLPYTKWENRDVDGEGEGELLDIVVESSHKRETFA